MNVYGIHHMDEMNLKNENQDLLKLTTWIMKCIIGMKFNGMDEIMDKNANCP